MTKCFVAAVLTFALPTVASASSINMSSALVRLNKDMGVSSSGAFGAGTNAPASDPPVCFGGACGSGIGCDSSPENPTALLAVLGAAGLLFGRLGYGRFARRPATTVAAA